MPDDRDVLKKKTPPAGVRAQTAAEFEEDDLTPLEGDQATQTLKRANQSVITLRELKKELANAAASQKATHAEVKSYAEMDQRDHAEMKKQFRDNIDEVKTDLREVKDDVKEVSSHISNVRADVAEMKGSVEAWLDQTKLAAANEAHETRVKLSYRYGVKSMIWKSVLKVAALVAGAIGTGVAGYYVAKWFQH